MASSNDDRTFARIDLEYSLCSPWGRVSPNTQSKTWFFELPRARDTDDAWGDLLHRLFYDANVRLGRAEPNDQNFLNLETFTRMPVDLDALLAADVSSWEQVPWFVAQRNVVWEGAPCYFVDDEGQYDLLGASDFTELILNRLLNAGRIDEAGFVAFFDRLFALAGQPSRGQKFFDERATRFLNLVGVRPGGSYKRPPGSTPRISGPVDPALRGG
jgi:hypothetical protein